VNIELLRVKTGVRFNEDRLADHLLHLLKPPSSGRL
jgi:hypothetical protein